MVPQPPPGQGPIDPRGAFSPPPPPPTGGQGWGPPPQMQPPPGGYPPMMMPPPPPPPMYYPAPPKERSFARAIFTTLAVSIFGFSLALNVWLLLTTILTAGGHHVHEEVLTEGTATEEIAVVPVSGVIYQKAADEFDRILTQAEKNANVTCAIAPTRTHKVHKRSPLHSARVDRSRF